MIWGPSTDGGSTVRACPLFVQPGAPARAEMWTDRQALVAPRDVLLVPPDVRRKLASVLPSTQFTVYGLSWSHAGVVTDAEASPYELYLPFTTARNRPDTAAALAATRHLRRQLCGLLPPGADAGLPLCRDVWQTVRGKPWRQAALDILFDADADAASPPGFPMRANVLVFAEEDVLLRDFGSPLAVEFNVPLRFDKPLAAPPPPPAATAV